MLDQNITILLSALLGGLLSIAGSIVANYYIQHSSNKTQKQKEIRNILELIYKSTQTIIDCCREIEHQFKGTPYKKSSRSTKEKYSQIYLSQVDMITNLQKAF